MIPTCVLRQGAVADAGDLIRFIEERLARYKRPQSLQVLSSLCDRVTSNWPLSKNSLCNEAHGNGNGEGEGNSNSCGQGPHFDGWLLSERALKPHYASADKAPE